MSALRRAFTLLNRAWNRFANVDVLPHQQTTKDPVSNATLSFVRPPQLQMSMYGPPGATFALPYPPGDGYQAAKAIKTVISQETDGKLRERLQKTPRPNICGEGGRDKNISCQNFFKCLCDSPRGDARSVIGQVSPHTPSRILRSRRIQASKSMRLQQTPLVEI